MGIKELLQKGFWTLLARSLGAGLMFLMTILFARWLGASDFGLFSLGLTIMAIMSVISRWGTDQVLLKQVGAHWETDPTIARDYAMSAIKLVLSLSLIISVLISFFNEDIAIKIFNKPEFSEVLFWFGLIITPLSLNWTLAEAYKGKGMPVLSTYLQSVITPLIAIVSAIFLFYLVEHNLTSFTFSYGAGTLAALLISFLLWRIVFKNFQTTSSIKIKQVFAEGWPMLLITSGALVMSWSDMIIIGIFSSAEEVGIYSAASKTVLVTSLILVAMNSITAPKYSKIYREGRLDKLAILAQNSSKILIVLVTVPTTLLLVFPKWVMSIFGEEYIAGATILMVLAIGQFINVATGSVGYILTMTGNENVYRNIMLITAFLNILLSIYLFQVFGTFGVAIATAISISIWNIWSLYVIKKNLGFSIIKVS
jgi:O-antigen/teichoic acid export membrane protein